MKTILLKVGQQATNSYLHFDKDTNEVAIIDPGDDADYISTTILENKLNPKYILLTHGHFDHCLGTLELKLNFNIPIFLHKEDLSLYHRASSSAKYFTNTSLPKLPPIDHFIDNNDQIPLGKNSIKVIHTPGHTPGSVCFYTSTIDSQCLFTGDTLFKDSIGDTNHKYSNATDLKKSLSKIRKLPPKTVIYPGHEDSGVLSDLNGFFF